MTNTSESSLSEQVKELTKNWHEGIPTLVPNSTAAVLLAALNEAQKERDELFNSNLRLSADIGDHPEIIKMLNEHISELKSQLEILKDSSL